MRILGTLTMSEKPESGGHHLEFNNLQIILNRGEDSRHQFKRDVTNADSLAAELVAFANCGGGQLFLGVDDDGSIAGLGAADVRRLNQLLSKEWPSIELLDDVQGNQSSAVIRRPVAEWATTPLVTPEVTDLVVDPVTDPVAQVLRVLANGPMRMSDLQDAVALKHRPTFRANYLHPALELGMIEMTNPESPNSPQQKYRLTPVGQAWLQKKNKNGTQP